MVNFNTLACCLCEHCFNEDIRVLLESQRLLLREVINSTTISKGMAHSYTSLVGSGRAVPFVGQSIGSGDFYTQNLDHVCPATFHFELRHAG